jgi:hypothetical protein
MKPETIMRILAFAGAIPFFLGALGAARAAPVGVLGIGADLFLVAYGAVILSFLAGIHWGQFVAQTPGVGVALLLSSNVVAILAWLAVLLEQSQLAVALLLLVVGFVCQLWIDWRLLGVNAIPAAYFRLRGQVTAIVLACLAVPLGSLLFSA